MKFLEGNRKTVFVGGGFVASLVVACVALFVGKMTGPEWTSAVTQILAFGGGAFVAGNLGEAAIRAFKK